MSGKIRTLLQEIKVGLKAIYQSRLQGLYLFGSYARGEEDKESDLDVLVVLDGFNHYAAEVDRTGDLCAKLSLKYDVSISRVFVSGQDWKERRSPFLENVREEAIAT